jgi:Flp pilus assembly protein TadG
VILESAIMMLLLLLLLFGIVDVGRVLYTANNAVSAAREGARFAAIIPGLYNNLATDTLRVKDTVIAKFSAYRFGGSALVRDSVRVQVFTVGVNPQAIRVTVSYPFTWLTPIPRLMGWGNVTTRAIHAQAEYRYEQ